jgi:hypothetical protein
MAKEEEDVLACDATCTVTCKLRIPQFATARTSRQRGERS